MVVPMLECTRVHHVQGRLDKMHVICSRAEKTWPLTQAIEVEVPLSEAFDRLELPNEIDDAAWEGFKGHTIYMAEGIDKQKRVGLNLPQVAKGDPPSSLDMLIKVEQSLTMPCQEHETSSMEGFCRRLLKD